MARPLPLRPALLACLSILAAAASCDPRLGIALRLHAQLVADGFASPVQVASPSDGSGRLFVVDQVGIIWIVKQGRRLETPFLDLRPRLVKLLSVYDERGLLGLAFHPRFESNGRLYVYYSAMLRAGLSLDQWDHSTRVSEFRVSLLN